MVAGPATNNLNSFMATYIQKTDNSDVSPFTEFNKVLSSGTGTDTGVTVSVGALASSDGGWITPSGTPNSDSWESGGTQTVEIELDSGNMSVDGQVRIVRVNSSGTILQSGSYTANQTLFGGPLTFSPVSPTWTGGEEDCTNRLAIQMNFTNTDDMMAQAVTVGLGTTSNEVVTDITENNGTCSTGTAVKDVIMSGIIPFAR